MKRLFAVLTLLAVASCTGEENRVPATLDLAAEPLPFPRPAIEPLDSLAGVPPLPERTRTVLDLRRAFFAGNFARLDAALTEAHRQYVSGGSPE